MSYFRILKPALESYMSVFSTWIDHHGQLYRLAGSFAATEATHQVPGVFSLLALRFRYTPRLIGVLVDNLRSLDGAVAASAGKKRLQGGLDAYVRECGRPAADEAGSLTEDYE